MRKIISATIIAALLSGCATMQTPRNDIGSYYAFTQTPDDQRLAKQCLPAPVPGIIQRYEYAHDLFDQRFGDRLNPGDSIGLTVVGDDDLLSKTYVLNAAGQLNIMGRYSVTLRDLTLAEAENTVRNLLVREGMVRNLPNNVSLTLQEMGGIAVAVNGAVFESGIKRIGERQPTIRAVNLDNNDSGDANMGRSISIALQAAGGIRPDAELRSIYIVRGQRWSKVDLSGAVYGSAVEDFQLQDGDQIIVPSAGCFQEALVKPSSVTAPGIRVFLSNLSGSSSFSATSHDTSLPYGSRLSQAIHSASCVGGSAMNAGRKVVLFSRNPINGKSVVISRSVEGLVRDADRDSRDPYLMPGDSIACYDSVAMNLRDVVRVIGETATPFLFFNSIN